MKDCVGSGIDDTLFPSNQAILSPCRFPVLRRNQRAFDHSTMRIRLASLIHISVDKDKINIRKLYSFIISHAPLILILNLV